MDPLQPHEVASSSHIGNTTQEITGNHFGNNNNIHQGNVVHNHWPEDEVAKCLSDLRTTDPRDDKIRIERTKGGLLKDSYKWILEHGDFQQWRDNDSSRLLWIKGDPGKGKTMLLCGIADELSSQQNAEILVCYFFCQAADSRINSATAILRGLIYLAIEQRPMLISHVQRRYKHGGDALFKDINAWTALSEIFSNILNDASLKRVFVIIDALDECITDLPNLLDFISTKSALLPQIKWIVSSRNWPDIEDHLNPATQQTKLCLELNESSISEAVDIYIKHKVKQLAQRKAYDVELRDTVQHQLSSRSNNTFLWVALVCQNLGKISLQNTLQKLNEFPPGLDSLYERMIKQIHHLEHVNDAGFCFQILATVLLVYQPVTLAELGHLVKFPDGDPADIKLISRAIGLCGSFLTIRDERVYIIHQSAKDYLNKTISTFLPLGTANIHGIIFSHSLNAMTAILRRNVFNLDSLGISIYEIKTPDPDPLRGIRYSCIYWADHFCDMHCSDGVSQHGLNYEMSQMISPFLQKYFLYWLEALGLIGHMEDGVLSTIRLYNLLKGKLSQNRSQELTRDLRRFRILKRLKSLFQETVDHQSPDHQLLELAQGSRRFIQQSSRIIANYPLQVYVSALIFSPSNCLTRKLFRSEEPSWLKVKPLVDYDWSPCLQTLEGHSDGVNSVAFSTNGYLASGSYDGTIKIWDITTGKELRTLKCHRGYITVVAFLTDSYLASGSTNDTIKIWDITTGKELRTLEGHSGYITSVAFSTNGYLASGSNDKTIKIWDITAAKELRTLKGRSHCIKSVAFSTDGYLASGSLDGIIKIWDITTGREQRTFQAAALLSIAFSADGCYLASGLNNHTTRIWDMTVTDENKQIPKGHVHHAAVSLSKDGRYVASGSQDSTITIWDTTTGKEQHNLKGKGGSVISLAFSADGHYLASGSGNGSIQIWNIKTGKEQQTRMRHENADMYGLISMAFSADGFYLASGSSDGTLKLWDTATGKELPTIDVHRNIYAIYNFDRTDLYLHTDIGPIQLNIEHQPTVAAQAMSRATNAVQGQDQQRLGTKKADYLGYGLSLDHCWITWNGHGILWLPPECRPIKMLDMWPPPLSASSQSLSTDTVISILPRSGKTVTMRMSSAPYSMM